MTDCKHEDLEFLGTEKSDVGQNRYVRCRKCGEVLVETAEHRLFAIEPNRDSGENVDRQS